MMEKRIHAMLLPAAAVFTALVGGTFLLLRNKEMFNRTRSSAPSVKPVVEVSKSPPTPIPLYTAAALSGAPPAPQQRVRLFSAAAVSGASPVYDFSMYIPANWDAQSVRALESLNLFESSGSGKTAIESSAIFIRYFRANSFLTLSSVKIISRKDRIVAGRPAVDYLIEKKPGYPNFPKQPSWRNRQHRVVDVRISDPSTSSSPSPQASSGQAQSIFYVFAKSPDLPDAVFDAVLDTLTLAPQNLLFYPLDAAVWLGGETFAGAVSKKPFGIFVTPTSSPILPEKSLGYHAGVDVEIPELVSATAAIPVIAIADGVVEASKKAPGYGGVVAVRHQIGEISLLAIYGHLNPKTLVKLGVRVKTGQAVGMLGRAFTPETDGERRHLHIGLYKGTDVNIAEYAQKEEDLQNWLDPLAFFRERIL